MRILPDRPNLDFLRREAKDLLTVLRDGDPAATLAGAQRELARQYGKRSWTDLKAEVDRRSQESLTAPPGLADDLAVAFGLGAVDIALPVSFTPMGRSWALTTDRGRWLAVTVYPWIDAAQSEIGERLRTAAVDAGIAAPTPVRSPHGRLIETVHDQNWRVHAWMDHGPNPTNLTALSTARRVGRLFGTLHALAIPSEAPVSPYLISPPDGERWARLLDRARAADKAWAERFAALVPALEDLSRIRAEIDPAAMILCNCNLQPETVRIGAADELIITEWDFTGSLTPELEVGNALVTWLEWPNINPNAVAAFRDGYLEAGGDWPDLRIESFAAATTSRLNWISDMVCEAISPSDADHADFAERETLDMFDRVLTRSRLEELINSR